VPYSTLRKKKSCQIMNDETSTIDDNLLADVIHKIKNGLGGIGGFAALLDRDLPEDDPGKRLVQRIQDGVIKVNDYVISLMTLARAPDPCHEKVHLSSFIKGVWLEAQQYDPSGRSQDQLPPHFSDEKFQLHTDPIMLHHFFLHLIRFLKWFAERIETIKLQREYPGKIQIEFTFIRRAKRPRLPENLSQLIQSCDSLEARLSLAIVCKLAKVAEWSLSHVSLTDTLYVVRVELTERIS